MNSASILSAIALICYLLLIEVTLRNSRQRHVSRAFATYLSAMAFWQFAALMVSISRSDTMSLVWYRLMTMGSTGNYIFLALFVQAYLGAEKKRWLRIAGWICLFFLLVTSFTDLVVRNVITSPASGLHVPEFGPLLPVLSVVVFGFLGHAVVNLVIAYRRTPSTLQRSRLRYLLTSIAVGLAGMFSNMFPVLQGYPVDVFANVISALLIAYAILRHQLLDISVLVRKGLIYSIPTLVVGASYFLVVSLAVSLFNAGGGTPLFVLSLIVAMVAALAMEPVRLRIQSWIDQLFFREKYDARQMIENLSDLAATLLDLDVLVNTIILDVSKIIHINRVAFLLKGEKDGAFHLTAQTGDPAIAELVLEKEHPVVQWLSENHTPLVRQELEVMPVFRALWGEEREELEKIGAEVLVPVTAIGELVAIFALGPKLSQQAYTSEDLSTLTTLANQTAMAIGKARLYRELERTLAELRGAHDDLEQRVQERTAALAQTNLDLQNEITERTKAEQQVAQSLREKEALLKEIHHRVKNNMQVVSSLLSVQAGRIEDPISQEILLDSQNRVRSMALIHEKLYQSENIAQVNLCEYAGSLASYLFSLYRKAEVPIELKVKGDEVLLTIDEAVPCGLILNELISNALKHAFPVGWEGEQPWVSIEMEQNSNEQVHVQVSDNGRGLPVNYRPEHTQTLGLVLVRMLVNQLGGKVDFSGQDGTTVSFSFHKHE